MIRKFGGSILERSSGCDGPYLMVQLWSPGDFVHRLR